MIGIMIGRQFLKVYFYTMSLIMIILGLYLILHIGLAFETVLGTIMFLCGVGLAGINTVDVYKNNK